VLVTSEGTVVGYKQYLAKSKNSWRTQELGFGKEFLTEKSSKGNMLKNSWRTQELSFSKEFLIETVVKKICLKNSWRTQELTFW